MKKNLNILAVIIIIVIAIVVFAKPLMLNVIKTSKYKNAETIYTRIENKGIKEKELTTQSESSDYLYSVNGIKSDGSIINLSFYGMDGKQIHVGSYLKLAYSDARGVISWEYVKRKDIPSDILNKIDK